MALTPAQLEAVNYKGNVALIACPGSGKTRTIAAKAAQIIDTLRGTPRKVACITYTNAAAREVESRLKGLAIPDYDSYCEISTIHSFCLSNILAYFHWLIPEYRTGYEVLPPDSEEYKAIVADVCSRYGLDARARDQFELLGRTPEGAPIPVPPLTADAALGFWLALEREGFVDFANIVYHSYRILRTHAYVTRALASRYAWFLVDEFQDTSALQVEILSLIAGEGKTGYFIVGDPFQSIYRFAGARPDLFKAFASSVRAEEGFRLHENWRSSVPVVRCAETLFPRIPPMNAVGPAAAFTEEPVYVDAPTPFAAITEHFLPALATTGIPHGRAVILAPWWITLLHLGRQLREFGLSIVGPGARPYHRHHLLAPLAEEMSAYIAQPDPDRIMLIERELFWLVSRATGADDLSVFTYQGRVVLWKLLCAARQADTECSGAGAEWLKRVGKEFTTILREAELLPRSCVGELTESAESMLAEMQKNNVDVSNLSTADIGLFARHSDSLRLLTMHAAKGLEFDAVAVVDVHDGRIPHFSVDRTSDPAEKAAIEADGRRLLYVAITRAKRVLMLITDSSNDRNRPSRFLGDAGLRMLNRVVRVPR